MGSELGSHVHVAGRTITNTMLTILLNLESVTESIPCDYCTHACTHARTHTRTHTHARTHTHTHTKAQTKSSMSEYTKLFMISNGCSELQPVLKDIQVPL